LARSRLGALRPEHLTAGGCTPVGACNWHPGNKVLRNDWGQCHLLHYLQADRWDNLSLSVAGSSRAPSCECCCGINPGLGSRSFPGPIKQQNTVLEVIVTRLYHGAHSLPASCLFQASHEIRGGCTERAECQSWLCLCALGPCVLESAMYCMLPRLKHKPVLAGTCMTTWGSSSSTPPGLGSEAMCSYCFRYPFLVLCSGITDTWTSASN